jgi:hypothetical protein
VARFAQGDSGEMRFAISHPSRKNKDASRVGHP